MKQSDTTAKYYFDTTKKFCDTRTSENTLYKFLLNIQFQRFYRIDAEIIILYYVREQCEYLS